MLELVVCDTPPKSPTVVTVKARIVGMALPGRTRQSRPTKGERHLIGARLPMADAIKLADIVEARGTSVSEYVARLLHEHLATVDIHGISNQESLTIHQAS